MNPQALVNRVKNILLTPGTEWPVVEAEPSDVKQIYTNYLLILAAIPAVAGFIGMSVFGISMMGFTLRTPILSGLVSMVFTYLVSLGIIFGMSLVVDYLAPTFLGTSDPLKALKLVAYSATAAMVSGILMLLPALTPLAVIGGLYSLYLFYIGVPVLMKCPQEKQLPYTGVMIALGVVAGIVFMILGNIFGPSGARLGAAPSSGGEISINTPGGKVSIDTAKLDGMAKQMEDANKRMEAAQKSGDPQATAKAAGEAMAAMTGALGAATGGGREPIPTAELKALMPEALGALKQIGRASCRERVLMPV